MKLINLNKFKIMHQVEIDGQVYDIYGIPVGDIIDDDPLSAIDKAKTMKEKIESIISVMARYSNISVDILKAQTFNVLTALIYIIQGIDPEEKLGDGAKGGKPGK